jgi:hypothetical protein
MNLCIPRVESTITKDYIYNKLCNLNAGKIEKLVEIPLKNDSTHKRILFRIALNNNEHANTIKEILSERGNINYVYEPPWFWRIVPTSQRI